MAIGWKCENCEFVNSDTDLECVECDKRKGWTYDGPDDVGDTCHESMSEKMDLYRRLK